MTTWTRSAQVEARQNPSIDMGHQHKVLYLPKKLSVSHSCWGIELNFLYWNVIVSLYNPRKALCSTQNILHVILCTFCLIFILSCFLLTVFIFTTLDVLSFLCEREKTWHWVLQETGRIMEKFEEVRIWLNYIVWKM